MEKSKRRLKVFENITGGFKEEAASRVLEIRGVGDLTGLISNLRRYGEIQMADYSNFIYGIIIVSYYDIRVAKNVYFSLDPPYSIKFLNYNAEHDYVALTLDEYDDYGSLLATCGEIMSTSKFDTYITVHFYDIRSARNAFCTINKRNDYKTFRSELDTSVHSDSTSPSPYLLPLSTKSSNESIFEEHRIKKLNSEKDEKIFKIHLETIYNNKDTRTTLMIRNIPNKYTQSMLLEAINKKFANTYDIFYLPIDFKVFII
jgi:RNA recognition motif 2